MLAALQYLLQKTGIFHADCIRGAGGASNQEGGTISSWDLEEIARPHNLAGTTSSARSGIGGLILRIIASDNAVCCGIIHTVSIILCDDEGTTQDARHSSGRRREVDIHVDVYHVLPTFLRHDAQSPLPILYAAVLRCTVICTTDKDSESRSTSIFSSTQTPSTPNLKQLHESSALRRPCSRRNSLLTSALSCPLVGPMHPVAAAGKVD